MEKAYLYPISNRLKTGVTNPYVDDFIRSMNENVVISNKKYPSNAGILNILKFYWSIDYIFLNWIEDLPDKKLGKIQTYIFLFIVRLSKLLGKKIVWTLHNNLSHYKTNIRLKKKIFNHLIKNSDYILTHSSEGVNVVKNIDESKLNRVIVLHHPVKPKVIDKEKAKHVYDILIWGTISPYKAVDKFLNYYHGDENLKKLKVCIAGKILSKDYENKVDPLVKGNITLINKFLTLDELEQLFLQSKYVLFTYKSKSVISSGALMDSLAYRNVVIGPNVGAFADLSEEKLVYTYEEYNEIATIIEKAGAENTSKKLEEFLKDNTWKKFSENLWMKIKKLENEICN
ncbi:MAG: glycosyltransferase, partial [Bacteroidales bacterium]|nr:glycosyltransferase [Bacteroidales bacterium]